MYQKWGDLMNTKEFDKTNNYRHVDDLKCCLTCLNARRWGFEGSYSEDPSDLSAMCLDSDAPNDPVSFGKSHERKYVGAFFVCDKWKKDKNIK